MMELERTDNKSNEGEGQGQEPNQITLDLLLDACLGFALSVSCVVLTYVEVVWTQGDLIIGGVVAIYMALAVAATLGFGSVFSEHLQQPQGQKALLGVYAIAIVCSVAFCAAGLGLVAVIFSSICLVSSGFLYSEFLNTLPRRSLMTVVDVLVACAGVFILILVNISGIALLAVHIGVALVALGMTIAFARKGTAPAEVISDDDSKARHIPLRGNRHTLFLIGFMFSSIELGFWVDTGVGLYTQWLVYGGAIVAAGVFSTLIKGLDERNYKDGLLKGMGLSAAVCLVPIIILPPIGKLVCLALFVFWTTLEVIVLLNAVIESARFNMIAPIWLYGREGAVFFIGVAVGALLYVVGGWFSGSYDWAVEASICVAVIVCGALQIRVNYQCYPFESALEADKDDHEIATVQEQTGRYKALWQRKIQTACDRYKLSPREREVLHILVKGRDTKYVMDTFCISQSTAKTHIYNIYRKFDIHSRQDLLDFIEEIEPDDEAIA